VTNSCKESAVDEYNNASMEIYPNPVSAELNIKTTGEIISRVTIIDVLGQIVYHQALASSALSIDVSSFAPGIYVLEAETTSGIMTRKFIRE
jgi:hypothetical protein